MILHFENARLIDPETLSDTTGSLTVVDGLIAEPAKKLPKGAVTIDCGGKCLAPGIVDLGVKIGEPGSDTKKACARRAWRLRQAE